MERDEIVVSFRPFVFAFSRLHFTIATSPFTSRLVMVIYHFFAYWFWTALAWATYPLSLFGVVEPSVYAALNAVSHGERL